MESRLDPDAILLAPLEVIAWSGSVDDAALEGFRRRLKTGLGVYITRGAGGSPELVMVTDLLREIPGITVTGGGAEAEAVVRMARQEWATAPREWTASSSTGES